MWFDISILCEVSDPLGEGGGVWSLSDTGDCGNCGWLRRARVLCLPCLSFFPVGSVTFPVRRVGPEVQEDSKQDGDW